jgi:hypothetical protein
MEPPKPIDFFIDPSHWGLPLALSAGFGRFSVAVLCFHIEINWSAF